MTDWTRGGGAPGKEERDKDDAEASGPSDGLCGRGLQQEEGENFEVVYIYIFF